MHTYGIPLTFLTLLVKCQHDAWIWIGHWFRKRIVPPLERRPAQCRQTDDVFSTGSVVSGKGTSVKISIFAVVVDKGQFQLNLWYVYSGQAEPGFHRTVCFFIDNVILFFCQLKFGKPKHESGPDLVQKDSFADYLLIKLYLCVMSRSAITGWVKTTSHNFKWHHIWNLLLEYSESQLQLSQLFMNGDQKILVQINQTWF